MSTSPPSVRPASSQPGCTGDPEERQRARLLVSRAVAGDAAARQELDRRLSPVLVSRVAAFLRGRNPPRLGADEVEDLVQAIWLRLVKDGGRQLMAYDPERGMSLEGYVGQIARSELSRRRRELGALKRSAPLGEAELDAMEAEPAGNAQSPEQILEQRQQARSLVERLKSELPPRGSAVFNALYVLELDVPEAAEMLGASRQVIYNWQHRIRSMAREFAVSASES